MSSSAFAKLHIAQGTLDAFSDALKSKLPLRYFSEFYDESELIKVMQEESQKVLATLQGKSVLNSEEKRVLVKMLTPRLQGMMEEWKAKNQEHRTKSGECMQKRIDFLVEDFKMSVKVKLLSTPNIGLEDMATFMGDRKNTLLDIFDSLLQLGDKQFRLSMKTVLEAKLKELRTEFIQKQRLHILLDKIDNFLPRAARPRRN